MFTLEVLALNGVQRFIRILSLHCLKRVSAAKWWAEWIRFGWMRSPAGCDRIVADASGKPHESGCGSMNEFRDRILVAARVTIAASDKPHESGCGSVTVGCDRVLVGDGVPV
ncbi:hypothetical protein NG791_27970 [Laspinema sp. D1]|uniref:hypothetical protein n=1 Tax=Laspinema palackyanum TaxID=3231601 RepID=UPI003495F700|nr:hypothetical protein [Laspinema sp. D2b]